MVGITVSVEENGGNDCKGGRELLELPLGWKGMVVLTVRVEGNDGTYC